MKVALAAAAIAAATVAAPAQAGVIIDAQITGTTHDEPYCGSSTTTCGSPRDYASTYAVHITVSDADVARGYFFVDHFGGPMGTYIELAGNFTGVSMGQDVYGSGLSLILDNDAHFSDSIIFRGASGSFTGIRTAADFGITDATVTAVPEPASWALMIAGFGAVGVVLRRRGLPTRRFGRSRPTADAA